MDDKWNDILNSLPPKRPRSRLEPYWELIGEMRRRGRTYREIACILAEKCQVGVSVSNLHHFVRLREKRNTAEENIEQSRTPAWNGVRQRIAAVKERREVVNPRPAGFDFDPREPLRLQTRLKDPSP